MTVRSDRSSTTAEKVCVADLDADESERHRAETFLALHVQVHNRLSAFVHTLVPSWQDAEEIVQDTLVVLWRKFDDFQPGTSFFAWATRVAQFEILNYRRKNRNRVLVLDDEVLEALACTALDQMDDLDVRREELENCIKRLSNQEQELLRVRYAPGATARSAAEAVQRTTGHVQRLLNRIRSSLLRCIQSRLSEQGL